MQSIWMRFALMVKRFHDLGHSGFRVFTQFIPAMGALIVLVMCGLTQGNAFPNDYGLEPLSRPIRPKQAPQITGSTLPTDRFDPT